MAIGLTLPIWADSWDLVGFKVSPLAAFFLVLCTWIQTQGSSFAEIFNNIVTSGKLAILALIALVSFANFEIKHFKPFLNEELGFSGVIEGSTILFFGYLGFDFITTIAEEAKNP